MPKKAVVLLTAAIAKVLTKIFYFKIDIHIFIFMMKFTFSLVIALSDSRNVKVLALMCV